MRTFVIVCYFSVVLKNYFCWLYRCSITGRSLCSSSLRGLVVVCWHCGFTDGSLRFTATVVLLGPHPDVTYLQFTLWTGFIHLICATYSDLAPLFPVRGGQITPTVFVSSKHIVQSSRVYSMKIETFTSVDGKLWGFWCCLQSTRNCVYIDFISAYKGNHVGRLDDYKHLF